MFLFRMASLVPEEGGIDRDIILDEKGFGECLVTGNQL